MRVFSLITLCTLTACESLFGQFIKIENCDSSGVNCQPEDAFTSDPFDMGSTLNDDLSAQDMSTLPTPDMSIIPPAGMLFVEGQTFQLGRPTVTGGADFPPFNVTIKSFFLDKKEVLTSRYKACVAASKCPTITNTASTCNTRTNLRDDHSVNCVNKTQAEMFCAWEGMQSPAGMPYRLPTEEEWELAATGAVATSAGMELYPWGAASSYTMADYTTIRKRICWDRPNNGTCAPGSLPGPLYSTYMGKEQPNGFLDLAGSLREWTSTPDCNYQIGGPCVTASGKFIVRGSSFTQTADMQLGLNGQLKDNFLRATYRQPQATTDDPDDRGFRCAKSYP
jgi:formylglycine-generating enzyme required for sulfatase activity